MDTKFPLDKPVSKQELIARAGEISGEPQHIVRRVLAAISDVTHDAVRTGRGIFLGGLGKLEVRHRPEKPARDIRRKTLVMVPAHNAVHYKASVSMERSANQK